MFKLTDTDYIEFLENLKKNKISDFYLKSTLDKSIRHDIQESSLRFELNNLGFYFLVTENLVSKIADFIGDSKCLEIMAGTGFFAQCLSDKGVSIVSTKKTKGCPVIHYWGEFCCFCS
jgi:putative methionine-R-sulfoxide reductase with GAF domain